MFNFSGSIVLKQLTLKNENKEYQFSICGGIIKELNDTTKYENSLNKTEKITLNSFKNENRYKNFLLSRYMAKKAVNKLLGSKEELKNITIVKGIFNFPIVKVNSNENILISITHSKDFICAIASDEGCPMAIDIEKIENKRASTVEKALSSKFNALGDYTKEDIAITHWTCIESLSKTLRTGVTLPLEMYTVKTMEPSNNSLVSSYSHFYQFKASSFKIDDYILTLCYPKKLDLIYTSNNTKLQT
ncbi:4'-phosphopantetheinyl transferase family protein [Clostridium sp. DL1XJH146]